MADEAPTFTRTVSGRDITFHAPTDTQVLVLGRLLRVAEKATEDPDSLKLSIHEMSKILDIIDSMIVDRADRDWLEEEILAGQVDLTELIGTLEEEQPTNRATKRAAAKKTSGTARARKS